jgi:hypothetical protein
LWTELGSFRSSKSGITFLLQVPGVVQFRIARRAQPTTILRCASVVHTHRTAEVLRNVHGVVQRKSGRNSAQEELSNLFWGELQEHLIELGIYQEEDRR